MANPETDGQADKAGQTDLVLEGDLAPGDSADVPDVSGVTDASDASDTATAAWAPDAPVVLAFEDLLPDDGGEVVADLGLGQIELHGSHAVVASGTADAHVTAGGYDVTGFSFFQFDNGLTVYVGDDTLLTVAVDAS